MNVIAITQLKILSVIVLTMVFPGALLAGSAQASANPYTPQGVCGSGYTVQRSHVLNGAVVYQLYNGTYNCVVTIKTAQIGTATRTTAGLQVSGSDWAYDTGDYRYYAGPVKQYGRGKCVRYFGYHGGTSYTSPWGNCN
ncbi:MAG TPA: serine/threonine protein kinase [Candidatus Saccharimonadia bacterium]|nr:serine/threonine protein kinase [Candidatus Saccharimonadia bacterium]